MNDRDLISAFVTYLQEHGRTGLKVESWPEDENRNLPEIDAIAGPLAIEHTSIDTLANQRRDSDWFMRVAGGLEQELPVNPQFRLNITLEYEAITRGQDWRAIRHALKKWITEETVHLADGIHVLDNIAEAPFRLHVRKAGNRPPGIFVGRFEPEDETLPNRIREQFDRKANKLSKYHVPGKTTVLLVENDDIALMSEARLMEAIQKAYPNGLPQGVDEVWYADTSIQNEIEFTNLTPHLRKKNDKSPNG